MYATIENTSIPSSFTPSVDRPFDPVGIRTVNLDDNITPRGNERLNDEQIKEIIDNPRIKEIARRATWLGNDETHYFRKWDDKDLEDLKKLIQITVHFISMELGADKYIGEMADE